MRRYLPKTTCVNEACILTLGVLFAKLRGRIQVISFFVVRLHTSVGDWQSPITGLIIVVYLVNRIAFYKGYQLLGPQTL